MPFKSIWSLSLAVMLLAPGALCGAQEQQPAEPKAAEQRPVEQKPAEEKSAQQQPVQQKPAKQKSPQVKSHQQKLEEARQKIFNPKNKKPTYAKPPKSTGWNRSMGGDFVSHETNMKVNNKDYDKKYNKYQKEVQKINEE